MNAEFDSEPAEATENDVMFGDEAESTEENSGGGLKPVIFGVAVAVIAVIGLLAIFSGGTEGDETATATALEEFTFGTADGGTTTLAVHSGEPLVINYFASWCPPCRAELPDFERVHRERLDEVTFIGVSRDNDTDSWLRLMDETGVTYETIFEGNVRGSYEFVGSIAMPTTVFVTAEGEIVKVWSGPLNDDLLNELIDEHLTGSAA